MGNNTKSRTAKELQVRKLELGQKQLFWDGLFGVVRTAVRSVAVVGCFGFVYLSTKELAGQRTEAILSVLASLSADRYFAYAVASLFGGAYMAQARANKKMAKDKDEYIKKLERGFDPNRSTSGLTTDGRPRPEDSDGA